MFRRIIKYLLPASIIIVLTIFIIFKFIEDEDFLSSLRYKDITAWKDSGTKYYLSVFLVDSAYKYSIRFSSFSERWIIHWDGDTTYTSKLACGYLSTERQKEIEIWGYDSSVILFDQSKILPLSVGVTEAYIKYPNRIDTLNFEVTYNNGILTIEERSYF